MYLLTDIVGPYSGKAYGFKGDEVLFISGHGDVAIVEGSMQRFSVKRDQLSETPVEKEVAIKPAASSTKKTKQVRTLF
jgi:hypothetical protein